MNFCSVIWSTDFLMRILELKKKDRFLNLRTIFKDDLSCTDHHLYYSINRFDRLYCMRKKSSTSIIGEIFNIYPLWVSID